MRRPKTLLLCSRTPRLLLAARSCKRMDKQFVSHLTMEPQSQLILIARDLRKLQLFPKTNTKLERTSMLVCWRSHLSHTTQMPSGADSLRQLLWCHIRTLLKSSLVIEAPTTRDNSFLQTKTLSLSQRLSRQLTPESFLRWPWDPSIYKTCEGHVIIITAN